MLVGMRAAKGESIVLLDGDLQNDPRDIPKLLAEIERGADLVCGYRMLRRDTRLRGLAAVLLISCAAALWAMGCATRAAP